MKAWFLGLSERERTLLLIIIFFFLGLLLYFYGWKALQRYQVELARDIKLTIEDREFIRQAEIQRAALKMEQEGQVEYDTTTSVQVLANPLLRRYQLDAANVLVRSEAKSKDAVSLKLENANFDALIGFIGEMEKAYNIKVSSMALLPTETTGLTGAQLTLER